MFDNDKNMMVLFERVWATTYTTYPYVCTHSVCNKNISGLIELKRKKQKQHELNVDFRIKIEIIENEKRSFGVHSHAHFLLFS